MGEISRRESLEALFASKGPDPWGYQADSIQERLRDSVAFIAAHVPKNFVGQFIEIGAFNGSFTKLLRRKFPLAAICVNDITPVALDQAREALRECQGIDFIDSDLTDLNPERTNTGERDVVLLLLERLYYMSVPEREEAIAKLTTVYPHSSIAISGPITGPPYFTEGWLVSTFARSGYILIDQRRVSPSNQVIYLFRHQKAAAPKARWWASWWGKLTPQ
jgi:hypothetical protein